MITINFEIQPDRKLIVSPLFSAIHPFRTNFLVETPYVEIQMSQIKPLYAVAFAFVLAGALLGCATYDKCGVAGCGSDAQITANVQARLARHAEVGSLVDVQTLDGVVYLHGQVNEGLQRKISPSRSPVKPLALRR